MSGEKQAIPRTLGQITNKFSNHWSLKYFGKELPLNSMLEEKNLAQKVANCTDKSRAFVAESMHARVGSCRKYEKNYSLGSAGSAFSAPVLSLAKESSLAKDSAFMDYLGGFCNSLCKSEKFEPVASKGLSLAIFGHAAASYELLCETGAKKEDIQKLGGYDALKIYKILALDVYVDSLLQAKRIDLKPFWDKFTRSKNAKKLPNEKNLEAVQKLRMLVQRITYGLIEYLQKNFGLVFVPQKYADERRSKDIFSQQYQVHTEPVFVGLNCDDTVSYNFGIPFLPLSEYYEQKTIRIPERDAIINGLRRVSEALKEHVEFAQEVSHLDVGVANDLKEHSFRFDEQLNSYANLLLPVSRVFRDGPSPLTDETSFPTFRFDVPLKEKFEELLSLRKKELPSEVISDIELTIKILDARRKLAISADAHEVREDMRLVRMGQKPSFWHGASAYGGETKMIDLASLALIEHEIGLKQANELNEKGIKEIIGYDLPEAES